MKGGMLWVMRWEMGNNVTLVDYGIQNEDSDLRAHVCIVAKRVFVFATEHGRAIINQGNYKRVPVRTEGLVTAEGYLVPPSHIKGCQTVNISGPLLEKYNIQQSDHTSDKGKKAVQIVCDLIKMGRLPLPLKLTPDIIKNLSLQIKGIDIILMANIKIQVKCDYNGGLGIGGGSGNLFLQVAECNPCGYH